MVDTNNRVQLAHYDPPVQPESSQLQELLDPHNEGRTEMIKDLADQYRAPQVDLTEYPISIDVTAYMPKEMAQRHQALPISLSPDRVLSIALAEPTPEIMSELLHHYNIPITFFAADPAYIKEAIEKYYI